MKICISTLQNYSSTYTDCDCLWISVDIIKVEVFYKNIRCGLHFPFILRSQYYSNNAIRSPPVIQFSFDKYVLNIDTNIILNIMLL
jgi:hypothetical protein